MSTGNRIITLNGDRVRKPKPDDPVTLDQCLNIVMNSTGPISKLLLELVERQKGLEDHVGYVAPESPLIDEARKQSGECDHGPEEGCPNCVTRNESESPRGGDSE